MTCLLYWLTGFRGEDFKTFFPIGSYVKTTVCPPEPLVQNRLLLLKVLKALRVGIFIHHYQFTSVLIKHTFGPNGGFYKY
jgi:hypothetical protein